MPERWQRTLEQLRSVDPDQERTWARAQQPPTGEGLPPRRQRVVAGVVALVVFVAAGAFGWQALRPSGDTTPVGPSRTTVVASFEIAPSGEYPQGHLMAGAEKIEGIVSGYTWNLPGGGQSITDAPGPDFHTSDYLAVERGSQLAVAGSADSVTGELQLPGTGSLQFERLQDFGTLTDPITLDAPAGRYVLHLTPTWPQGSVPFYFPIELVEPPPVVELVDPSAVVLNVTSDADGPAASISWGDESRAGKRGEYKWCDGSGGCVTGVPNWGPPVGPDSSQLSIPAGAPLSITGEVKGLKGGFFTQDGRLVSNVMFDAPGTAPDVPGSYLLEIHASIAGPGSARGTATFWFNVEITEPHQTPSPVGTEMADLVNAVWILTAIDGAAVTLGERPITIGFSPDRLAGNDGCNDFGGRYVVEPLDPTAGSIVMSAFVSTAVLCYHNAQEVQAFTERLRDATEFSVTGDTLTLRAPQGSLTFVDPLALDCDLVSGGTSIGGSAAEFVDDEAAIRALLLGLRPGDVIEGATDLGPGRPYVITRDGSTIAWAKVGRGPGDAVRAEFDACDGSGLSAAFPSA